MARMLRTTLLLFTILKIGQAADFGFGVRGGFPLTERLKTEGTGPATSLVYGVSLPFTGFQSSNRPYSVGPTGSVTFWRGLGVQADALYSRVGYESALPFISTPSSGSYAAQEWVRANVWTFPILGTYRLKGILLEAGVSASRVSKVELRGISQTRRLLDRDISIGRYTADSTSELKNEWGAGPTFGIGWEAHVKWLRFVPELRYTRMTRRQFGGQGPGPSNVDSNANQLEVMLGILAGPRR